MTKQEYFKLKNKADNEGLTVIEYLKLLQKTLFECIEDWEDEEEDI